MRNFFDPVKVAWVSVATHKLRSFLTILGVVIGVAAVIILMSVGKGTTAQIVSRISSLGTNTIYVSPGTTSSGGVRSGFGSASTLTFEDAEAIMEEVDNVAAVAPYSQSGTQVIAGGENMMVRVTGVTVDYQEVYNLEVSDGEFFTQDQYDRKRKVALLGTTVAETLFPDGGDIVGEKLRMSNTVFTVVGLLASKGESMSSSTDQTILIPLSTLQGIMSKSLTTTGEHSVSSITLQVTDKDAIEQVKEDVTFLLQDRHNIGFDEDNDFTVTSMDDLISTITEATQSMTLLLGAIAGISLLVGGIGVMNIMLVSVMERRREIGVRKALGARERDIWGQFLVDSALLTFAGGIIGVIIGWGGSALVNYLGWTQTAVTSDIVILAVAVSVGIGLFFGFYPAWQASKLDPIQALRSE
ncbi:MAG: ABC transporter permease [Dehalococcoidales bacterium]|nr:ABC transporter permease [Dehalococcoidales bacterium]